MDARALTVDRKVSRKLGDARTMVVGGSTMLVGTIYDRLDRNRSRVGVPGYTEANASTAWSTSGSQAKEGRESGLAPPIRPGCPAGRNGTDSR